MYIKLRKTRSPRGVDQKSAVIEIYIFLVFSFELVERILVVFYRYNYIIVESRHFLWKLVRPT